MRALRRVALASALAHGAALVLAAIVLAPRSACPG